MRTIVAVATVIFFGHTIAFAQTRVSRRTIEWVFDGSTCGVTGIATGFEQTVGRENGATIIVHVVGSNEDGDHVVLTEIGAMPEFTTPSGRFNSGFIYHFRVVASGPNNNYGNSELFQLTDVDGEITRVVSRSWSHTCSDGSQSEGM